MHVRVDGKRCFVRVQVAYLHEPRCVVVDLHLSWCKVWTVNDLPAKALVPVYERAGLTVQVQIAHLHGPLCFAFGLHLRGCGVQNV